MDRYSKEEIVEALERIKAKYPAVYKWFFIWELDKEHDSLRHPTASEHQHKDVG
jgi:hypothetical protein